MKTRKTKMDIGQKVVRLRNILGSKGAVVDYMGSASVSSLKRWIKGEVRPLKAHVNDVDEALQSARRLKNVLVRRIERRLERERTERGHGKRVWRKKQFKQGN